MKCRECGKPVEYLHEQVMRSPDPDCDEQEIEPASIVCWHCGHSEEVEEID